MPKGVPKSGFRKTKNYLSKKNGQVFSAKNADVRPQMAISKETDAQIRAKLIERFGALEDMGRATLSGRNRSMIVSGPAGVGKTFPMMRLAETLEKNGKKVSYVRGFVRPTGLYKTFYENRHKGCPVIFDDSDSVFLDEQCLGLLKTACDMTKSRQLSWLAETNMVDDSEERLPRNFEFEGSVIFITNYDFDYLINKGNKLSPHLQAMMSRSLYLDMGIKNRRDFLIRIQMAVEEGMLDDSGLNKDQMNFIVKYIEKNADRLRELSLRMVIKLAQLHLIDPVKFESNAKLTCCH